MKKSVLFLLIALMAIVVANAQQISVVSEGDTDFYRTLQEAIENAPEGSVIYLPGGGFPIADEVKITKQLTIIGVGHNIKNNNVDGVSTINGNIWFNEGSSGSGIIGCYISGNVNIGENDAHVKDILVKYCNLNSVQVMNNTCLGTTVNQNYIRNSCNFNGASGIISHNVMHSIQNINGGQIINNQLSGFFFQRMESRGSWSSSYYARFYYCIEAYNCPNISNNVITAKPYSYSSYGDPYSYDFYYGSDNQLNSNLSIGDFGDYPINIGDVDWNDVFVNYNDGAISPLSDFHFKDTYLQYENTVGIHAGTGFNDKIIPVPYIISKRVDDQTDASGMLNIKIRVKAGE